MRRSGLDRLLTPKGALGLLAALTLAVVLLSPWSRREDWTPALSSYGTGPHGARGLYDLLDRLGFRVERRLTPMRQALDGEAIYLVLDPTEAPTAAEVHNLLEAVRAGAGLLAIPTPGTRLADSLGVARGSALVRALATDSVELGDDGLPIPRTSRFTRSVLRRPPEPGDSSTVYRPPPGAVVFLSHETERGREPAMVGFTLGRGRVVVAADPEQFTNELLRRGDAAVRAVRLVEWLADGRDLPIVFDEFHHGYGRQGGVARVTRRALAETPPGRMLLQLGVAGLLLLVAIGARPVRPRPPVRIERRSPLEHVHALARAYETVGAVERSARLLVRGLRRRHGGYGAPQDEAAYLDALARRHPDLAPDIATVSAALGHEGAKPEPAAVATAIRNIERTLNP